MYRRSIFYLLFTFIGWLNLSAQVLPASPINSQLAPRIIIDSIPNWMYKIVLQPNEWVRLRKGKSVEQIYFGPILQFKAALTKEALVNRGDSILKESDLFGRKLAKTVHLKKRGVPLTISALYFDRACLNAGISRRFIYVIKGRKCRLKSDSTFDDSFELDSAVSARLQSFPLLPNQYFSYDGGNMKTISLHTILTECHKDLHLSSDTDNTPARKVTSRVLFEIVQRDFGKFDAVGCGCTAPRGEYHVDITGLLLNQENLRNQYDSLYKDYREFRWP